MNKNIHDAFEQISASADLKKSTKQYLQIKNRQQEKQKFCIWQKRICAAVCAAFLLVAGAEYYMAQTPVSYISIDVNPSMELVLNRFDRVISIEEYNEDAGLVLKDLDLEGKRYDQAIDAILTNEAMAVYLGSDLTPVFTVASDVNDKTQVLLEQIKNSSVYTSYGCQGYTADSTLLSEAHHYGMSFGKYAAYCELSQYNETITVEDCHGMAVSEMHNQIHGYQNGSGCGHCNEGMQHHGSCHEAGH